MGTGWIQHLIPPLLRTLYTQLANGGFGPAYGIYGAVGGYGTAGTPQFQAGEIITRYRTHSSRTLVDLTQYTSNWQKSESGPFLLLPYEVWPRQLAPICDPGGVQEACINQEGQLYVACASEENENYMLIETNLSLEQWIQDWLNDKISLP